MENTSDQQFLRTQFLNLLTPLSQQQVGKIVQYLKIKCSGKTGPQYRLLRVAQIALYLQVLAHSVNQKNYVSIQSITCQLQDWQAQRAICQIANILLNTPKESYPPSIFIKVSNLKILYKYINQIKHLSHLIVYNMQLSMSHKKVIIKNMFGMICWYASRTGANIYADNSQFVKIAYIVFSAIFQHSYGKTNEQIRQTFINVFGQSNQFHIWSQYCKHFHQHFLQIVKKPEYHSKGISDLTFIKKESDCDSFSSIIISQLNNKSLHSNISEPEQWRVISRIRLAEDHQEQKHHQFKSPPIVHPSTKVIEQQGIINQINQRIDLQDDEFQ